MGICTVELTIYESNSLKDKRQIVKSLIGRLGSRYNISIAEVGDNDLWNRAVIGFSLVANEKEIIDRTIQKILGFIDGDHRIEIIDQYIEII